MVIEKITGIIAELIEFLDNVNKSEREWWYENILWTKKET
jgi:hypothetical protein